MKDILNTLKAMRSGGESDFTQKIMTQFQNHVLPVLPEVFRKKYESMTDMQKAEAIRQLYDFGGMT